MKEDFKTFPMRILRGNFVFFAKNLWGFRYEFKDRLLRE